MPEYDDEPRAEARGRKLDAADLGWRDDVARDADDEQAAESLIEHDLRGNARIGATEHDREGVLCRAEPELTRHLRGIRIAADVRHEALISRTQLLESRQGRYPNL